MTNIQQICNKVQEPLGYKPSSWLLYNLLMRKHSAEKVQRVISLVEFADRINEYFLETNEESLLDTTEQIEEEIRKLLSEASPLQTMVEAA